MRPVIPPTLNQPAGCSPMAALTTKTYVCSLCQQTFTKPTDHDFDVCAYQFRMELLWRKEKGEVIHVN